MILPNNINRNLENKIESSRQGRSKSPGNFLEAMLLNIKNKIESSRQGRSFSEGNLLGALPLIKETLI